MSDLIKHQEIDTAKLGEYLTVMGLAAKLTETEKKQFIEISMAYGLNPFKREIYCTKYVIGGNETMSIIVGYETYIKRAERSGQLDGWGVITEGSVKDGNLKAVITIHRKDRKFPFVHEVYYSEYVQLKDGKPNKFWQKAFTMIKKVATAQGFRLCFSDELGGMPYTDEEVQSIEVIETKIDREEPTPDATKAVNDDSTKDQKKQIEELLKSDLISPKEKKKITDRYMSYNTTEALQIIEWAKTVIKERLEIQESQNGNTK